MNIFIVLFLHVLPLVATAATCTYPQTCGYLNITYPFNLENLDCGNKDFSLSCKDSIPLFTTPSGQYQILSILAGNIIINTTNHLKATSCNSTRKEHKLFDLSPNGPFTISSTNIFATMDCSAIGSFSYMENNLENDGGSCSSASCKSSVLHNASSCNGGHGCCQMGLVQGYKNLNISVVSSSSSVNGCVSSRIFNPSTYDKLDAYGLAIDFVVSNDSCLDAKNGGSLVCSQYAKCLDSMDSQGYFCNCDVGFSGDGYQAGLGCKDIDECQDPNLNECLLSIAKCTNTNGSYECRCIGSEGDGRTFCIQKSNTFNLAALGLSSFALGLIIAGVVIYITRALTLKVSRRKYFYQNGGHNLKRMQLLNPSNRKPTLFTEKVLKKATNNFSESNKVGSGGSGHVYRGAMSGGSIVAVKRCREVNESQIQQFVNEIVILSQLEHPNIVRLLGCCLESQNPILVYEYVSHGTLYDRLHHPSDVSRPMMSWQARVHVASEVACALLYLHSKEPCPIVHRDVKTSNILVDIEDSAKLADFGISRQMSSSNSHMTTMVKGTIGYLDPHYFATVQLSDKSDVYSFGVVMVELLTGLKPICLDRRKEVRNLAALFLSKAQSGTLHDIIDPLLLTHAPNDVNMLQCIDRFATLAKACLNGNAKRRPSMKEVVDELDWIKSLEHGQSSKSKLWIPMLDDQDEDGFYASCTQGGYAQSKEYETQDEIVIDPYVFPSVRVQSPGHHGSSSQLSKFDMSCAPVTHSLRFSGR